MNALFRLIPAMALLIGCGTTPARRTTPNPESDARVALPITDFNADQYSAATLIRKYVEDGDGAALYLSSHACPSESARVDSLVTRLLDLPPSPEHTRDYALSWPKLLLQCRDQRVASWYRNAIGKPQDDLTVQLLTKNVLRTGDPVDIAVVKKAAFDTANNDDARSAMLNLFVEELYMSGEERVELMIASYRQTGVVPGSFVSDQAPRLWALRTAHWREDLMAELVADPGKRGAGPLLLTLARETRASQSGSRWRKVWDTALDVLERHPQATPDLKAMIPIAREVAVYRKD